MPSTDRAGGANDTPAKVEAGCTLVVARAQLDAMLELSADSVAPLLAYGPLTLTEEATGARCIRTGFLYPGPVQRPMGEPGPLPWDGALVLALASIDETPPTSPSAWTHWVRRYASSYRLATPALLPALAVLWLRPDGLLAAAWHGLGESGGGHRWNGFDTLSLPGAGMLQVNMRHAQQPSLPGPAAGDEGPDGRYGRLAGAMGTAVLKRLQASTVAHVGLGLTGSAVAHSLARIGSNHLLLDPDLVQPHNLVGDLPPRFKGRSKAEAASRFVRGVLRPGADVDARVLSVSSPVAGALLADVDVIICCVDNDAARLWANAWALAWCKPLLDIGSRIGKLGAEADLRLLPPGTGCLACLGGFAQQASLVGQLQSVQPPPVPLDFRRERRGSSRSWSLLAAHAGLRLLEGLYDGRLGRALFRRLSETGDGSLNVSDTTLTPAPPTQCPLCSALYAKSGRAVQPDLLVDIARRLAGKA